MKYKELIRKFVMTSDGYDQAEVKLENGCTVRVIRKSTGSHTCYLISPRGVQIDTLGGADKYDVEQFIEDGINRDDIRDWDNRDWLHDLDDADLSYLDDY